MAGWNALLDAPGRPNSVTWTALFGIGVGGATLVSASVIVSALFAGVAVSWGYALVVLVAVVQVSSGVLLVAGGLRLATGASRRELVAGVVLLFVTCAAYGLYEFPVTAGGFAVAGAGVLYLALRPPVKAFVAAV